jgi:hypothetical protein
MKAPINRDIQTEINSHGPRFNFARTKVKFSAAKSIFNGVQIGCIFLNATY